ncbi:O176 family O-antigen flippase, partial [Escherichia coli]
MNMIRDIFNDGIYSLINKIGYFGAKTIAIILITRTLGVDEGSQFIFLISIIEIMRVIGDFGVDVYVIRKYGDVPNKERLLCTVFYQKIIVGFVFAAILIVYCSILKYNASIYVPLSLSIIFSLLFNLSSSYFQSLNINKAITTSIISASIFIGVLFSSFYYFNVVVNAYHFLVIEIVYCMSVSFTLINKTDLKIIRQFKKVDISAILY